MSGKNLLGHPGHQRTGAVGRVRCAVSLAPFILVFGIAGASAEVVISAKPTKNMTCSNGVCEPTTKNGVLNVGDLENLLASGAVKVTTTGSGVQARDIKVDKALTWSSANALSLDAFHSIAIEDAVSATGLSALSLTTDDGGTGGTLSFGAKGNITFANLSSALSINGLSFALVNTVQGLADAIAANQGGNYAFASNYDARVDGTYTQSPVSVLFDGNFEGLGNTISRLSIKDRQESDYVGLFSRFEGGGFMNDIRLARAHVSGGKNSIVGALVGLTIVTVSGNLVTGDVSGGASSFVGALVGENAGTVSDSNATAAVSSGNRRKHGGAAGGLVGFNGQNGTIQNSFATGAVSGSEAGLGGLAGVNEGVVESSYASGSVTGSGSSIVGGLVGGSGNAGIGTISNSYAVGSVMCGDQGGAGGLIGLDLGTISTSYSTGLVQGGTGSLLGGLIGDDGSSSGSISFAYWDLDTSGISDPSQGAGNIPNDPGITGLSTEQFQSGLPDGFDPAIWAESATINNGFPYLLANPPK